MYYGVRLRMNAKSQWLEGMKDWHGKLPERMTDDSQEESFWDQYLRTKETIPVDDWIGELRRELIGLIRPGEEVLEIGPGWGNYTYDAAEIAGKLTCVDSSASVLRFLEKGAGHRGLRNMSFVHAKWEEPPVWDKADLVFGVNCYYRMQQIDRAMIHMNNAARRLAVIGMTSGPEKPHYWEIRERLGCRIKFSRRDYIDLTNVLYELGIDANCKIVNLSKTYTYENEEHLIRDNLSAILDSDYDRRKAEDIVRSYATVVDGKPVYEHHFKAALLYWTPERLLE